MFGLVWPFYVILILTGADLVALFNAVFCSQGLFVSGIVGDRLNLRWVLSFGMCSSALVVSWNIVVGFKNLPAVGEKRLCFCVNLLMSCSCTSVVSMPAGLTWCWMQVLH